MSNDGIFLWLSMMNAATCEQLLKDFYRSLGYDGIDVDTLRLLIDNGVRLIIQTPLLGKQHVLSVYREFGVLHGKWSGENGSVTKEFIHYIRCLKINSILNE